MERGKQMSFFVQLCSVEHLQHMYAGVQQQLMGSMANRRTRGSVGSLDGGRIFNDAIGWISQQKVRGPYKDPPRGVLCLTGFDQTVDSRRRDAKHTQTHEHFLSSPVTQQR